MQPRWILTLALVALLLGSCGPDTTWRPAFDAEETGWIMNVWGLRDDLRIAVGGSLERGRAVHHDGVEWAEREVPADTPLLNWVTGFSPTDIWAVGANGTILRFDGEAWGAVESPTDQDLWGVWGAAPDDIWAVGGTARPSSLTPTPTVIHWDGAAWSLVETPPLERTNVRAFFKVWGSGPDDVYVVGAAGVVLRWDGASWTELFVGAPGDLVALWGTGPDHIVAVGGRGNGFVSYWNGETWRTELVPPYGGFNGVWTRRPGVAHVVGIRGGLITFDPTTFTATEAVVSEGDDFHAIHGVDGRLVAVGGNLAVPSDPRGMAWTRELEDDE